MFLVIFVINFIDIINITIIIIISTIIIIIICTFFKSSQLVRTPRKFCQPGADLISFAPFPDFFLRWQMCSVNLISLEMAPLHIRHEHCNHRRNYKHFTDKDIGWYAHFRFNFPMTLTFRKRLHFQFWVENYWEMHPQSGPLSFIWVLPHYRAQMGVPFLCDSASFSSL